ncbi:MAG: hypothetical protein B7Y00_01860, partial [Sphingomonadales bacterium 17-56-6]
MMIMVLAMVAPLAPQAESIDLRTQASTQILCVKPNAAKKRCEAIADFERTPDGAYVAHSTEKVPGGMILKYVQPVRFSKSMICGVLTLEVASQTHIVTADG